MGNRLTKIVTRKGDSGETSTANGSRIAKDDLLMHVQGDIDELNSVLGLLAGHLAGDQLKDIRDVQHVLFDIGGEISLGQSLLKNEKLVVLEKKIDAFNLDLKPLKEFILPGGNEAGALCHLARTVCRRVERNVVSLYRSKERNPVALSYLNRLSDFLFVFARVLNDKEEIYWQKNSE